MGITIYLIRIKCGNIYEKLLTRGIYQELFSNYLLVLSYHACFSLGSVDPMHLHLVLPWLLFIMLYLL